jgi:hypothetical protein
MIEKFNLSDKREDKSNCLKCEREWKCVEGFYNETDVKEFIKLLKERMLLGCGWSGEQYEKTEERCSKYNLCENCKRQIETIDELAGDKLI